MHTGSGVVHNAHRIHRVTWRLLTVWVVGLSLAPSLPAAEKSPDRHFLWGVDSPTTRVYLMGSIHMLRPNVYPLAPAIEEAFAASDVLVLEADIFADLPEALMQLFEDYASYPPGQTLKSELPEPDYWELIGMLLELGIPSKSVQQFRPWYISLMADQVVCKRLGLQPEYGIDFYFRTKAVGQKSVEELESVEAQLEMFSSFSDQESILMLSWVMEDLEQSAQDFDRLLQYWKQGDVQAMEKELQNEMQEDPRFKPIWDIIVDDRNLQMADRIVALLASKKRYFVVVGAAHLIGPKGLVALLQQRGYAIQQL